MYNTPMTPAARAESIRNRMSSDLAASWLKGEHNLVKIVIECGETAETRRQWKDDTAAALPTEQRETFLQFMRG